MIWDLVLFTSILLSSAHEYTMSRVCSVSLFPRVRKNISSAYAFTLWSFSLVCNFVRRSLTYKLKRIGEIRLPYGQPLLKAICSYPICRVILEKMSLIMSWVSWSMPMLLIFLNRISWLILLNADLKSIKVRKYLLLECFYLFMWRSWLMSWVVWIPHSPFSIKPTCCLERTWFIGCFILFRIIASMIFWRIEFIAINLVFWIYGDSRGFLLNTIRREI